MDNKGINGRGIAHLWGKIKAEISAQMSAKQDKLTFDSTPIEGSTNPVTSDGVQKALQNYAKSEDIPTTEETVNAVLDALPTWQGGEY